MCVSVCALLRMCVSVGADSGGMKAPFRHVRRRRRWVDFPGGLPCFVVCALTETKKRRAGERSSIVLDHSRKTDTLQQAVRNHVNQGSRVRPSWSYMQPTFVRVQLKMFLDRTSAPNVLASAAFPRTKRLFSFDGTVVTSIEVVFFRLPSLGMN